MQNIFQFLALLLDLNFLLIDEFLKFFYSFYFSTSYMIIAIIHLFCYLHFNLFANEFKNRIF